VTAMTSNSAWAPPGWAWLTDEHGHIVLAREAEHAPEEPAFSALAELAFLARVACTVALAASVVLIACGASPADLLLPFPPAP